jgi:TPR repeat protein
LLIEGVQVERDLITGESWLRRAAAAGDHEAARSIAELYLSPGPLPPNVTEGANWLRRAAELGDKIAARKLADLYFTGTELGYDPQEGARWLVASAETGMPNPAIIEDFRRQFEDAACQGDPVAAFNLAICLMEGWGTEQNKMEAENWLRKSAEYLPQAQYVYGRMLAQGDGAEPDLHAARAWLTRAAKAGFTEAQAALAEMMLNGRGGPASPVQAKSLFEQAAAQQHVGAMFALGAMHSGGHGIPIDLEAAKKWLTAAAERGHLRAEDSLARLSTYSGANVPSQNAG